MTVPRPRSLRLRLLCVAALTFVGVGAFAPVGQAAPGAPAGAPEPGTPAPTTSAQALAQLRTFNDKLERSVEDFNDAKIDAAKKQKLAAAAGKHALVAARQYAALSVQIRRLVSGAYKQAPLGEYATILSSGSPQQFVDQLGALSAVSARRAVQLRRAGSVRAVSVRAQGQAQAALAAAQKLQRDLGVRKADLTKRVAQSTALYNSLSATEKAQLQAQHSVAAPRASRSTTRAAGSDPGTGAGTPTGSAPSTSTASPSPSVPPSGKAAAVVAAAESKLGSSYVWGQAGPSVFDCSGLTMWAWARAGVSLPHSSRAQFSSGTQVSMSALQAGDLVFYEPGGIHHVAIYVGNGQVIHAPQTGDVVRYASVDMMAASGAVRPG